VPPIEDDEVGLEFVEGEESQRSKPGRGEAMMSQVENLEARDFVLEIFLQSTGECLLLRESGTGDCGCSNESDSSGACLWRLGKEAEA